VNSGGAFGATTDMSAAVDCDAPAAAIAMPSASALNLSLIWKPPALNAQPRHETYTGVALRKA
jgi:hypothetical protein